MSKEEPIRWFARNIHEPLFSHSEVLELAGGPLKHDTLQNWANRGYIDPAIESGKRRYRPPEVATVILAQQVVSELRVEAGIANRSIFHALVIIVSKLSSNKLSIAGAERQIAVYSNPGAEPTLYDASQSALEIFGSGDAFMVVPIGRLLANIASKQRKMVESRDAAEAKAKKRA